VRLPAALTGRRVRLVLAAAVVVALGWVALPRVLRGMAFFRVRRVEILGTRYLPGDTIVAEMALSPRASVFDPVEPLEQRVFAIVGVREVTIRRRLPGTLRVELRESEPVALTDRGGRLALMDERGRVLPFDPTRVAPDLPLGPAEPGVARLLARVREVDPALYAELVSAVRVRSDVILEAGPRRRLVRADASAEVIQNMAEVARDLARRGRDWRELDGRFAGRVIVRGLGA